ncbi:MAG: sodium:calcium antiporter [Thermoleophilia bacterium]
MRRHWWWLVASGVVAFPGLAMRVGLLHGGPEVEALLFGVAIVGGAFILSWAAEVAQLDMSQGLALSLLALIAVLPEYVVDASFAWLAASKPEYVHYAVANMTGANRLLIGIAWPLVVFLVWFRFRRTRVELEEGHGLELIVLAAASLYAFSMPLKGSISLVDFVVMLALFAFYMYRVAKMPSEEPHLVGPARLVGELTPWLRRTVMAGMALFSGAVILLVAHPFAEALVESGTSLGIDEFLLVQWVAPLASEAPEFIVVLLFAWRGMSTAALGTLVSSKINQWTLLVGMLPVVYSIALGGPNALPLDTRQQHEVFLTAAQSMFAMALLLNLSLSTVGASMILGLFLVQAVFPETRMVVGFVYLVLAVLVLIRTRHHLGPTFRTLRR